MIFKECALRLWSHGWDVEDVCEAFGVSGSSCYRWRQILEEHGTIKRRDPLQDVLVQSRTVYCQLFRICLRSTPTCFSMKYIHGWRLSTTSSSVFLHFPVLSSKLAAGVSRRCSSSTRDSGYFHLLYRCG
jgi:hypothetical protein